MYHNDPAHTGLTNSSAPLTVPREVWSTGPGEDFLTSPVIVDGIVYMSGYSLYAFNATTGKEIWEQLYQGYVAPAVNNGVVYTEGTAFNASNGALLWNVTIGGGIIGGPTVAVADGYYYTLGKQGSVQGLVCLNASTGSLIWNSTYACWSPSPAISNGTIYFGTGNSIIAVNAYTGSKLWENMIPNYISSSPAVDEGRVYYKADWGLFVCLDAGSGKLLWNYTMVVSDVYQSSPAVAKGFVYVGSGDGNVYALNATNGEKIWSYQTQNSDPGYGVQSSPAIADGAVYVGSDDGYLYCLNASTGVKLWSYQMGKVQHMRCSPAIANGRVYMGSEENFLIALGTKLTTNGNLPPNALYVFYIVLIIIAIVIGVLIILRYRQNLAKSRILRT
jgi:outer membrane protein assembly factor BamB